MHIVTANQKKGGKSSIEKTFNCNCSEERLPQKGRGIDQVGSEG